MLHPPELQVLCCVCKCEREAGLWENWHIPKTILTIGVPLTGMTVGLEVSGGIVKSCDIAVTSEFFYCNRIEPFSIHPNLCQLTSGRLTTNNCPCVTSPQK